MSMSVVFAGSPSVAVPYLRAIHAAGFEVRAVITRLDAPVGRRRTMTPTPVAVAAEDLGLPVIKANSLRDVTIPSVALGVVVAYGGLVPDHLLAAPHHGWINVHFSVLPEYRGAAPVQRALWDDRDAAGISIFHLVSELDAGPVYFSKEVPFTKTETASMALERIATSTTEELVGTMRLIDASAIEARPQNGEPTFAPKFSRSDARVDWSLPAATIATRIRAVTSEPGAYTELDGATFGIVAAEIGPDRDLTPGTVSLDGTSVLVGAGAGTVRLVTVKPPGKAAMDATDWARGLRSAVQFA